MSVSVIHLLSIDSFEELETISPVYEKLFHIPIYPLGKQNKPINRDLYFYDSIHEADELDINIFLDEDKSIVDNLANRVYSESSPEYQALQSETFWMNYFRYYFGSEYYKNTKDVGVIVLRFPKNFYFECNITKFIINFKKMTQDNSDILIQEYNDFYNENKPPFDPRNIDVDLQYTSGNKSALFSQINRIFSQNKNFSSWKEACFYLARFEFNCNLPNLPKNKKKKLKNEYKYSLLSFGIVKLNILKKLKLKQSFSPLKIENINVKLMILNGFYEALSIWSEGILLPIIGERVYLLTLSIGLMQDILKPRDNELIFIESNGIDELIEFIIAQRAGNFFLNEIMIENLYIYNRIEMIKRIQKNPNIIIREKELVKQSLNLLKIKEPFLQDREEVERLLLS